jgi:hypothetical protein
VSKSLPVPYFWMWVLLSWEILFLIIFALLVYCYRQCCGSESELFSDSDPDTCKIKLLWKIADQTFKREKNVRFSVGKPFSLSYRFQNTYRYESNERHHFKKFRVKISIRIRILIRKKCVDPNSTKMNLDPKHWFPVLVFLYLVVQGFSHLENYR